jgi:hypothetical protein
MTNLNRIGHCHCGASIYGPVTQPDSEFQAHALTACQWGTGSMRLLLVFRVRETEYAAVICLPRLRNLKVTTQSVAAGAETVTCPGCPPGGGPGTIKTRLVPSGHWHRPSHSPPSPRRHPPSAGSKFLSGNLELEGGGRPELGKEQAQYDRERREAQMAMKHSARINM